MKKAHKFTRLLRSFVEGSEVLLKSKRKAVDLTLTNLIFLIPKALLFYAGMLGLWGFLGLYLLYDGLCGPKGKTQKPVKDD